MSPEEALQTLFNYARQAPSLLLAHSASREDFIAKLPGITEESLQQHRQIEQAYSTLQTALKDSSVKTL